MFNFPTIYLGSGRFFFVSPVGKVFCFLLFLFVCFCFYFFIFFWESKNSTPPWYQMLRPYPYSITQMMVDITSSTIFYFEFPCNSVKNLIPIWNFTNTFIQECKIIWEFQIRWGGTSLLRHLWRSWRYLKAYSLMSNRGRFFFFFAYFRSPPLRSTIPKRN